MIQVSRVCKVHKVLPGHPALRVPKEHKELQAEMVYAVGQDQMVPSGKTALPVLLVLQALLDPSDLSV